MFAYFTSALQIFISVGVSHTTNSSVYMSALSVIYSRERLIYWRMSVVEHRRARARPTTDKERRTAWLTIVAGRPLCVNTGMDRNNVRFRSYVTVSVHDRLLFVLIRRWIKHSSVDRMSNQRWLTTHKAESGASFCCWFLALMSVHIIKKSEEFIIIIIIYLFIRKCTWNTHQ